MRFLSLFLLAVSAGALPQLQPLTLSVALEPNIVEKRGGDPFDRQLLRRQMPRHPYRRGRRPTQTQGQNASPSHPWDPTSASTGAMRSTTVIIWPFIPTFDSGKCKDKIEDYNRETDKRTRLEVKTAFQRDY